MITDLDLKSELDPDLKEDILGVAVEFFRAGGALTFDEWIHIHPTLREVFVQARDKVKQDELTVLAYILRAAAREGKV